MDTTVRYEVVHAIRADLGRLEQVMRRELRERDAEIARLRREMTEAVADARRQARNETSASRSDVMALLVPIAMGTAWALLIAVVIAVVNATGRR